MEPTEKAEKEETQKKQNAFQRFKRTKTWTLIEILSPVLGILIPVALYIAAEKSGQVTVRGIQQTSLIDTKNEIGKDVTVLYNNARIANVIGYTLEVANTGNTDIGKQDVHYFKWFPPASAQILSARIIGKTGDTGDFISVSFSDPHYLNIDILALNKGVSARINILCSSDSITIDNSGRVDGVIKGASIIDKSRDFTTQQNSFLANVFAGGIWTNLAKAVIFSLITLVVLLFIFVPLAKIDDWRTQKRIKEEEENTVERARQLVMSVNDPSIDKSTLSESDIKYLAETIDFFKDLTQEQFNVCRRLVKEQENLSYGELIFGDVLTLGDKKILATIPNIEYFFKDILRFKFLHKPQVIADALVRSGRFAA